MIRLFVVLFCVGYCYCGNIVHPVTISKLLSAQESRLDCVVSVVEDNGMFGAEAFPAGVPSVTLTGQGCYIPEEFTNGVLTPDGVIDYQPIPEPPGASLSPRPPPSGKQVYSLMTWIRLATALETHGPAILVKEGQTLTFSMLLLYLVQVVHPLGASLDALTLTGLALSGLIRVEQGGVLVLDNVDILLSQQDLGLLYAGLCASTNGWTDSPGVTLQHGVVNISSHTTTAPGGGKIFWRNVLFTSLSNGLKPNFPCSALSVSDGETLLRSSYELLASTTGPVFIMLLANVTLPSGPSNSSTLNAERAPLPFNAQLHLLGHPSRPINLDFAGREAVWVWTTQPSNSSKNVGAAAPSALPALAVLYDITLVNLPFSALLPSRPADLLSLSLPAFRLVNGRNASAPTKASVSTASAPRVSLERCSLVLPDGEVGFLRGLAASSDSSEGQQVAAAAGITQLQVSSSDDAHKANASAGAPTDALLVQKLVIPTEVQCTGCTLLPASAYAAQPGAVPLLPQSLLWPPLLLHGDQDAALHWGPTGLSLVPGLLEAVSALGSVCGQPPDGARAITVDGRASTEESPSGSLLVATQTPDSLTDVAAWGVYYSYYEDESTLSTGTCEISGYPPELKGGLRTFLDLQGAVGRSAPSSGPLTLRNLVLYNLGAPGWGAGTAPAAVTGPNAAWATSALPLWYFDMPRAVNGGAPSSPASDPPLLRLHNVTLVVPEPEWRAMAAAVLLRHAPEALAEAAKAGVERHPPPPTVPVPPPLPPPTDTQAPPPVPPAEPSPPQLFNPFRRSRSLLWDIEWVDPIPSIPPYWPAQPPSPPAPPPRPPRPPPRPPPQPPLPPPQPPPQPTTPPHPPPSPELPALPPAAPPPDPPPPAPPANPSPPPSPPYGLTTRAALLAFAAASQPLSYDPDAGLLVLGSTAHLGWYGSNVTLTYRMPGGAPADTSLMPYPSNLALPYQDLADMAISVAVDFSRRPPTPSMAADAPAQNSGPPSAGQPPRSITTPQLPPKPQSPAVLGPQGSDGTGESGSPSPAPVGTAGPSVRSEQEPSSGNASGKSNSWAVPVTAALSVVGGVMFVLGLTAAGAVAVRRRRRQWSKGLYTTSIDIGGGGGGEGSGKQDVKVWLYSVGTGEGGGSFISLVGLQTATTTPRAGDAPPLDFRPSAPVAIVDNGSEAPVQQTPPAAASSSSTAAAGGGGGACVAAAGGAAASAASGSPPATCAAAGRNAVARANLAAVGQALTRAAAAYRSSQSAKQSGHDACGATQQSGSRQGPAAVKHQSCPDNVKACAAAWHDNGDGDDTGSPRHPAAFGLGAEPDPGVDVGASEPTAPVDDVTFQRFVGGYFGNRLCQAPPEECGEEDAGHEEGRADEPDEAHSGVPAQGGCEALNKRGRRSRFRASRNLSSAIRCMQAELGDPQLVVHGWLSRGAYGIVYRGSWRGLPVAIKTLVVSETHAGREGRQRQRAVLEAAISLSMEHPNVVATYTYSIKPLVQDPAEQQQRGQEQQVEQGRQEGATGSSGEAGPAGASAANHAPSEAGPDAYKLHIVQELCNGGSLTRALEDGAAGCVRAGGPFAQLALRLALDVAAGMRHVHACRIVHGDLKPDNVLLVYRTRTERRVGASTATSAASTPYISATSGSDDAKVNFGMDRNGSKGGRDGSKGGRDGSGGGGSTAQQSGTAANPNNDPRVGSLGPAGSEAAASGASIQAQQSSAGYWGTAAAASASGTVSGAGASRQGTGQDQHQDMAAAHLQLTAKVADFGLSLPLAEGASHASHCFHGTPIYAAPEVTVAGRMGPGADVWSFGLMLMELYYGCTLSAVGGVLMSLGGADGIAPVGPHVSVSGFLLQDMLSSPVHRPYAELVSSCLALEPRERPGFGEIAERLERLYVQGVRGQQSHLWPCGMAN